MTSAATQTFHQRAGVALIAVSCVLYALLLIVPFLPVATNLQMLTAAGLVVTGEGAFWIGCLFAGKDFMMYLRRKLWPGNWRSKTRNRSA